MAAEDLLELLTHRYETAAILVSSNRLVEDWGQVLGGSPLPRGPSFGRTGRKVDFDPSRISSGVGFQ
jgi:IstB-like ATP binding protein